MRVDTGRLRIVASGSRDGAHAHAIDRSGSEEAGELAPELLGEDRPTPGAYLRAQRKRRGMSLDQLSIVTKIPRRQLELLEEDRYGELPGMVFTKGFLRCCARALELDPDTVLGLLYDREREQLRARRREISVSGAPAGFGRPRGGNPAQQWIARQFGKLPSSRILLWLVVALLVAIIVLIAFTLASSQAESLMIRS